MATVNIRISGRAERQPPRRQAQRHGAWKPSSLDRVLSRVRESALHVRSGCAPRRRPAVPWTQVSFWLSQRQGCACHLRDSELVLPATQCTEAPTGEERGALPASFWPDLPPPPQLAHPAYLVICPALYRKKGFAHPPCPAEFSWVPNSPQPAKNGYAFPELDFFQSPGPILSCPLSALS